MAITQEGRGQAERAVVQCHPTLLHRLKQAALGARWGAVDLVREHYVREDWAWPYLELRGAWVVDRNADHVRGEKVAGELDAAKLQAERAGQRVGERGLADPGDVLEQDMAARQQRGEGESHDLVLTVEDPLYLGDEPIEQLEGSQGFADRRDGVWHRFQSGPR